MIDTNDKATQPLPLDEQPMKRKRGRPSTGKAMTPAEKQRAYRERQKKLRDQKPAADHQTVQALDQEVRKLLVELERANARIAELEKELASRDQKSNSGNFDSVTRKKIEWQKDDQNFYGAWRHWFELDGWTYSCYQTPAGDEYSCVETEPGSVDGEIIEHRQNLKAAKRFLEKYAKEQKR